MEKKKQQENVTQSQEESQSAENNPEVTPKMLELEGSNFKEDIITTRN